MLFNSKSLTSALVAMVSLSIAVSASLDPIEQHLAARDSHPFQPSKEAPGKLATPVNLAKSPVSPQAVFKLTGQDLHSNLPGTSAGASSSSGQSAIAVPDPNQKSTAELAGAGDDGPNKGHCYLSHDQASIKRIRYTMRVQIDRDESGATTTAEAGSVRGVVIKATSGLYSKPNPDEGSCAKTLARHGEVCANRPYIVPQSILPTGPNGGAAAAGADKGDDKTKPDGAAQPKPEEKDPEYHAGPLVTKRSPSQSLMYAEDEAAPLVFKREVLLHDGGIHLDGIHPDGIAHPLIERDVRDKPAPGTNAVDPVPPLPAYKADTTVSGSGASISGPAGTVCIDTVKRDHEITKVVPTKASPKDTAQSGVEPLHFELVRSDDKQNVWNQIIYNSQHKPIDVTHLSLTEKMSVWRAEYKCESCSVGHQKHTVLYENVEIELDDLHEATLPAVQCEGQAQSTNAHKRKTSRYANKNGSGVGYTGAIIAIDRVTLGVYDGKGHGAAASYTAGQIMPVSVTVPEQLPPAVDESKKDGQPKPNDAKPNGVNKRDVVAEADGPIF
ncbi:hypothetical protein EX895_000155 [Sporisorium graminicola]|uniref:Uncharacterized protein n=1 Tax=Sporisorium graminicola TaxID=280036 RepID=A0A4U7L0H1_9BASI|nr:hypothetical protein EX895_000155 [Sporisorium graminicola]TKY90157.1 hypothetical protein EX895_000155 [Sporisorium graminicola]